MIIYYQPVSWGLFCLFNTGFSLQKAPSEVVLHTGCCLLLLEVILLHSHISRSLNLSQASLLHCLWIISEPSLCSTSSLDERQGRGQGQGRPLKDWGIPGEVLMDLERIHSLDIWGHILKPALLFKDILFHLSRAVRKWLRCCPDRWSCVRNLLWSVSFSPLPLPATHKNCAELSKFSSPSL